MKNPVCFVICNNLTSHYTQKSQTTASAASLIAWLTLTFTFIKYSKLESHKSYVPTGMAFLKPGHKCVPNVPFRDTGTSRSIPGLSRSNRDVWSPWPSPAWANHAHLTKSTPVCRLHCGGAAFCACCNGILIDFDSSQFHCQYDIAVVQSIDNEYGPFLMHRTVFKQLRLQQHISRRCPLDPFG